MVLGEPKEFLPAQVLPWGVPPQPGGITIGNSGAVNLSGQSYSLSLRGLSGGVTFANTLTLPNNTTFDLSVGTSSVTGGGGTDLVIGGGMDGFLWIGQQCVLVPS